MIRVEHRRRQIRDVVRSGARTETGSPLCGPNTSSILWGKEADARGAHRFRNGGQIRVAWKELEGDAREPGFPSLHSVRPRHPTPIRPSDRALPRAGTGPWWTPLRRIAGGRRRRKGRPYGRPTSIPVRTFLHRRFPVMRNGHRKPRRKFPQPRVQQDLSLRPGIVGIYVIAVAGTVAGRCTVRRRQKSGEVNPAAAAHCDGHAHQPHELPVEGTSHRNGFLEFLGSVGRKPVNPGEPGRKS